MPCYALHSLSPPRSKTMQLDEQIVIRVPAELKERIAEVLEKVSLGYGPNENG